jgi:hypothetical protein
VLTWTDQLSPNVPAVAAKVMDGEAIIFNLSNGLYYSTEQVGGLIWSLIEEGRNLDQIASAVARAYDVEPGRARADAERLVAELLAEDLVRLSEGAASEPDDGQRSVDGRLTYEPPVLHKFSDMADLLALDPPMPGMQDIPWQRSTEEPHAR